MGEAKQEAAKVAQTRPRRGSPAGGWSRREGSTPRRCDRRSGCAARPRAARLRVLTFRGSVPRAPLSFTARGVVFGLIGFFLARAAYQYDPKEAVGLDGALSKLLQQHYGSALLGAVAAGLIAFGLYCLAEARYREV